MKHLNISGVFTPTKMAPKSNFLESIQENKQVHDYKVKRDVDDSDKFKLGPDEYEVTFKIKVKDRDVSVLVYLQLDEEGKLIEEIQSFTGIDYFVDIAQYEKMLLSIIKESSVINYHYEITIDAHSAGYQQK